MFDMEAKRIRYELFPDGSNMALKTIMSNAKKRGIEVFWDPVLSISYSVPKGYDIVILKGTTSDFIRYYTNDLKEGRASIVEYIKTIKSLCL